MPYFVGLDAAKRTTRICIADKDGTIVREGEVETSPKAIVGFLRGEGWRYKRVGMESWSLAPWLYAGLAKAGLPIICIETRQTAAVLKTLRANKSDRNDARGIAEIMRVGIYKSVHVKTSQSRAARMFLATQKILVGKLKDIENAIASMLLLHGLKLNSRGEVTFEARVRKLAVGNAGLEEIVESLLTVRAALRAEVAQMRVRICQFAAEDPICRRLMSAPGVGPIVALTYRTAIDEPGRFSRSRDVGAHLGLTPRLIQTGEKLVLGSITKFGDASARSALFLAARALLIENTRPSWLKDWGRKILEQGGAKRAAVAVARRLAVVLHRMWVTETDFRWEAENA